MRERTPGPRSVIVTTVSKPVRRLAIFAQRLEKVKRAFSRVGGCEKPTFGTLVAPVSMDKGMVGRRSQNGCENPKCENDANGMSFCTKSLAACPLDLFEGLSINNLLPGRHC